MKVVVVCFVIVKVEGAGVIVLVGVVRTVRVTVERRDEVFVAVGTPRWYTEEYLVWQMCPVEVETEVFGLLTTAAEARDTRRKIGRSNNILTPDAQNRWRSTKAREKTVDQCRRRLPIPLHTPRLRYADDAPPSLPTAPVAS